MRTIILLVMCLASLAACFPEPPRSNDDNSMDPPPDNGDPTANFNATTYAQTVQPLFDGAGCLVSGCHDINGAVQGGNFGLYPNPAADSEELTTNIETIVAVAYKNGTPATAQDTLFFQKSTVNHFSPLPDPAPLEAWLNEGIGGDGGGGGGDGGGAPVTSFDATSYAQTVQPLFDNAGCLVNGCHDIASATPGGGFGLYPNAEEGSAELVTNIETIVNVAYRDGPPTDAQSSLIYQKSTVNHFSPLPDPAPLETWLSDGIADAAGGGDGGGGNDPTANFDATDFAQSVQPILRDAGCLVNGCHDIDSPAPGGGFGLYPDARVGSADLATNVENAVNVIYKNGDPASAQDTLLYQKATVNHFSPLPNAQPLEDWIAAGL